MYMAVSIQIAKLFKLRQYQWRAISPNFECSPKLPAIRYVYGIIGNRCMAPMVLHYACTRVTRAASYTLIQQSVCVITKIYSLLYSSKST